MISELVPSKKQVTEFIQSLLAVPDKFLCPLSKEIMNEPVIDSLGYSYDKQNISSWFKK